MAGLWKGVGSEPSLQDYGFGVVAWIGLLKSMFFLYLVLSVLAFTMVFNYKSFNLLDPSGSLTGFKKIGMYSMGSIGYQQNLCIF